jgi:transitional endoplasmic reticulum ATPase
MIHANSGTLPKGFLIDEQYSVVLFIKYGRNAETYRVKRSDGKICFLKLFSIEKTPPSFFDEEGNLLEISLLKKISHENIASYADSGILEYENTRFSYLVLNFIIGETLRERINRESFRNYYDVRSILSDILRGLNYLHTLPETIIHNEITPDNVMLDLSGPTPKAVIIDFGFARPYPHAGEPFSRENMNPDYLAPECFLHRFTPQSDVFSAGAVMYHIIFGIPPWYRSGSRFQKTQTEMEEIVLQDRKNPLSFPRVSPDFVGYQESANIMLKRALSDEPANRFLSASDFLHALNDTTSLNDTETVSPGPVVSGGNDWFQVEMNRRESGGFSAVAGMKNLKEQLRTFVIDALNNPEEHARYGLSIPNGMLLYGPPGCGKTYFAKRFAEEVGKKSIFITPSTLKSRYVNATQENIARLFDVAEKNAPVIIFIDEINELIPNRDSDAHEMSKSASNEMLAQMDQTGERGIFVIGATNYPHLIDPAMLRAGRLEKKIYLPPPDFDARMALFKMYLKNRPADTDTDYAKLAQITENYVSADIQLLVNEASRQALRHKSNISMAMLEDVINNTKPSVSLQELKKYEQIRAAMEGEISSPENPRRPIGFLNRKNNEDEHNNI